MSNSAQERENIDSMSEKEVVIYIRDNFKKAKRKAFLSSFGQFAIWSFLASWGFIPGIYGYCRTDYFDDKTAINSLFIAGFILLLIGIIFTSFPLIKCIDILGYINDNDVEMLKKIHEKEFKRNDDIKLKRSMFALWAIRYIEYVKPFEGILSDNEEQNNSEMN